MWSGMDCFGLLAAMVWVKLAMGQDKDFRGTGFASTDYLLGQKKNLRMDCSDST